MSKCTVCGVFEGWAHNPRMHSLNANPERKETEVKNVVAFLRLDKDQRAMRKAGLVDDNGNLTEDGKTVLLNLLLETQKTEMAAAAREYNKGDKGEDKPKD